MTFGRGQALLELALCAPVVLLLSLGAVAGVEVASARAGLDAATQSAAEAAARAANAQAATAAAQERFQAIVGNYPVQSATLVVSVGNFERGGKVTASSSASIDIAWAALLMLPSHVTLRSDVSLPLESWRSRST